MQPPIPQSIGWQLAQVQPMASTWKSMQEDETDELLLRGPQLWRELHHWALTTDRRDAPRWLVRFATRIGCGECRREWETLVTEHPPDCSSNEALFAWSVAAHNAVNRRLGKPEMSLEAAEVYWKDRRSRDAVADRHQKSVGNTKHVRSASPCAGCGGKRAAKPEGVRR